MSQRLNTCLLATIGLFVASTAQAQSAGQWMGRLGATQIAPSVNSGDLSAPAFSGTKTDVSANTQVTAGVTWMLSDNIAIDVPLSAGFTHELTGAGAIQGVGKIGDTQALPITVFAQYRFMEPSSPLRPYVGIGPTYAKFYNVHTTAALTSMTGGSPASPTSMRIDSKLTMSVQVGATWAFAPGWGLDATLIKTKLATRATLSTGQTQDITLDPTSVSIGLTRQF